MPQTTESRVAVIEEKCKGYDKDLKGNGQEGVIPRFIKCEQTVIDMSEHVETVKNTLLGIEKTRNAELAIQRDKEKRMKKTERNIAIIGGIVVILMSADKIIALIQKLVT